MRGWIVEDYSFDHSADKESVSSTQDPSLIPGSGRSTGEEIGYPLQYSWAFLVAQLVKNPPAVQKTWVLSLGWEDPLDKGIIIHSSILAWRIPWTVCRWGCKELDMTEWLSLTHSFLWLSSKNFIPLEIHSLVYSPTYWFFFFIALASVIQWKWYCVSFMSNLTHCSFCFYIHPELPWKNFSHHAGEIMGS